MPHRKERFHATPPSTGYSHAAKALVQGTAQRVREMHGAIADQSFDILQKLPFVSLPASFVRSAHNAIASGVYAAIHHGAGGLLDAAALLEKHGAGFADATPPGRLASGVRSALNGAFGDHLAASNNRLAINMAIHVEGSPLILDSTALRKAFPQAGKRLCLFIHGLSCDEHSWKPDARAAGSESKIDFGRQLFADLGYTPLYLRYNSGLPIAENGAQLAALLQKLVMAWPQTEGEILIIAHSMGGLIALDACEQAAPSGMPWLQSLRMLICLGSPHLGSPVERLGQLTTSALELSKVTAPLGKMAGARSQGIKDLRHGRGAHRAASTQQHIAFRFLGASLSEDLDHPFSKLFGDGLVTLGSATAHAIEGDVQSARLGDLGHMGLLTDRRVYRQIRQWLDATPAPG